MGLADNFGALIEEDRCPVIGCAGELDTGFECNSCGYDAAWYIAPLRAPDGTSLYRDGSVSEESYVRTVRRDNLSIDALISARDALQAQLGE